MDVKTIFKAFRHRSLADELEIEKLTAERDDFRAKFKKAVADLAAQAGEIARLTNGWERSEKDKSLLRRQLDESEAELAALRPDALAMRRKRQMDRDRRKGR